MSAVLRPTVYKMLPCQLLIQIESGGGIVGVQEDSDNDNVLLPMEYPALR